MFENAEVAVDELPKVDTVDWQFMDPRFMRRRLAGGAIALFLVAAGIIGLQIIFGIALGGDEVTTNFTWLWLVPVATCVPGLVWPFVSVPKKAYAVRDRDILYKSGVFWLTVTAIPFNRIQHVEKSSTPLDRKFHLATLQLFTAGGSGGDLKIHGLSEKTAEKLRTFIVKKVGSGIEQV